LNSKKNLKKMICFIPTFVIKMAENVCGIYSLSSPRRTVVRGAVAFATPLMEDEVSQVPKYVKSTRFMKPVTWRTERPQWIYRHVI
jgi:hypothetical protein